MGEDMQETINTVIETGEYRTYINRQGEGNEQAILFLHGSGPGATAWSNWQHALPALEDRYDCIAPDLIGFGKSSHPDDPPTGVSAWLKVWVAQQVDLLDALGLEKVSIVGNSLGGAIALHLLHEHPDRFDRAVLMGTGGTPMLMNERLEVVWGFYDDPTAERMANILSWFAYDPAFVGDDLDGIAKMRLEAAMNPDVRRSFTSMFPSPRQEQYDAMILPEENVKGIENPVLLVHGRDDVIVPLETSVYLMERLSQVQMHVFGRCSHWTQIEYRHSFNRLLAEFFKGEI